MVAVVRDSLCEMPCTAPIAIASLVLWGLPAEGQQSPSKADRFSLYNHCAPLGLAVDPLSEDTAATGLAKSHLEALAESRLRAADLFSDDALTILRVGASRYAIEMQYMKPVIDVASNESETIRTFSRTAAVRDGTAAGAMLEVSKLLDLFLVEYARVNESVCGEAAPVPQRTGTPPPPLVGSPDAPGGEPAESPPSDRNPEASPPQGGNGIRSDRMWPVPEDKETVHRVGGEVSSPRLRIKFEPGYTQDARDNKVEGTVMLAAEVREDGRAHNIRVLESIGYGLDEKAVEAVEKWTFDPGRQDGKPVRVLVEIQISFRLI